MRSFSGRGQPVQISVAGGVQARWRGDGKELFYIAPDGTLMAAPIKTTGGRVEPETPLPLFPVRGFGAFESLGTTYVPSADGQRILVLTSKDAASPSPIRLVLNWSATN